METINLEKLKQMEKNLGCTFCDDGDYAEMSQILDSYVEQTLPIADVEFHFFDGDIKELQEKVAIVDSTWPQYFTNPANIFCGYYKGQLASFCCVDEECDCIISEPGIKVGTIGCVGTVPEFRKKGIGLRMVDLSSIYLKENGCKKCYISYTHIDYWYSRLGYKTFARFTLKK